jgi:hypothetical protein
MTMPCALGRIVVLVVVLGFPRDAAAQNASMLVEADVADVRLVTRTMRGLSFGELQPGRQATIDPRMSSEAGLLEIEAAVGTEFRIAMRLPDRLESTDTDATLALDGDAAGCPIQHVGAECVDVADNAVWEAGVVAAAGAPGDTVRLRLGGTVAPPDAQPPGMYRGTVVASLTFTAN